MVCQLLEDLVIPDLQSTLLCQFLSGILVKSFFLYYTQLLCQPCWINSNLIVLLSSDTILAELAGSSSQNSSAPPTPHPDRSPKNNAEDGNDCFNQSPPLPTSTGDEHTPPQKLEECLGDDMRFLFGKPEVVRGSSGGSVREYFSPLDWMKMQNDSPQSSRMSRGSPSPTTSVSSALSGILPATAFPLLPSAVLISPNPSNCNRMDPCLPFFHQEDVSELRVDAGGGSDMEDPRATFSRMTEDGPQECDRRSLASTQGCQAYTTEHNPESQGLDGSVNNNCVVKEEINSNFKATTPTHYFSFEEVSTRKASHPMLDATTTLSVDGGIDSRKKAVESTKASNTHELKIIGNETHAKNSGRSPVYEEPEDFATRSEEN